MASWILFFKGSVKTRSRRSPHLKPRFRTGNIWLTSHCPSQIIVALHTHTSDSLAFWERDVLAPRFAGLPHLYAPLLLSRHPVA